MTSSWLAARFAARSFAAARALVDPATAPAPWSITRPLPGGLGTLHLAAARPLSRKVPGNGGLRLWHYATSEAASVEARGLGLGMDVKHATFNTGFAGAKLVCAAAADPSTWTAADKKVLLDEVSALLLEQRGAMYTGCDINITTDDMADLSEQSPYVLAAIGNPECCPNTATAYGVFGAVEATLGGCVAGKSLLVHGCGNVGSTVSRLLVEHGAARVHTFDAVAGRADIDGCVNVSTTRADSWWKGDYDAIVPCSKSGLFTEAVSAELRCSSLVGATNLPFQTRKAQETAEVPKGITFVPEGVSSAGAVIVDSIEHYRPSVFAHTQPTEMYEFTRAVVREKTVRLLSLAGQLRVPPSLAVPLVAASRKDKPVGMLFHAAEADAAAPTPLADVGKWFPENPTFAFAANSLCRTAQRFAQVWP